MFKKNPTSVRLTLRALGYLLSYPDAQLRSVMPQLIDALQLEQALTPERVTELTAVCQHLAALDPLEAEARYVDNFDRGRQTSLHLFEHVHGDSRDRGPALIDLMQTYEKAGLQFEADELRHHTAQLRVGIAQQVAQGAQGQAHRGRVLLEHGDSFRVAQTVALMGMVRGFLPPNMLTSVAPSEQPLPNEKPQPPRMSNAFSAYSRWADGITKRSS